MCQNRRLLCFPKEVEKCKIVTCTRASLPNNYGFCALHGGSSSGVNANNHRSKGLSDDRNYMIFVKSKFATEEPYRVTTDFVAFTGSMSVALRELDVVLRPLS